MAKLSKANQEIAGTTTTLDADHWDPLINTVSTPASQKLMPPPRSKSSFTPAQQTLSSETSENILTSSTSKKKRRSRGKKGRVGRDSFSENATTISDDTITNQDIIPVAETPVVAPTLRAWQSILSQDEQNVFSKEPELFGDYATSSNAESDTDHQVLQSRMTRPRAQTYSPSLPDHDDTAVTLDPEDQTDHTIVPGPEITSLNVIPNPTKLSNGRFACPLNSDFHCGKTFTAVRAARRHADIHVNPTKFKCDVCGQGFWRNDLYNRHIRTHPQRKIDGSTNSEPEQNTASGIVQQDTTPDEPANQGDSQTQSYHQELSTGSPESNPLPPEITIPVATYTNVVTSAESETESQTESETESEAERLDTGLRNQTSAEREAAHDEESHLEATNGTLTDTSTSHDSSVSSPPSERALSSQPSLTEDKTLKRKRPTESVHSTSASIDKKRRRQENTKSADEDPREDHGSSSDVDMGSPQLLTVNPTPHPSKQAASKRKPERPHLETLGDIDLPVAKKIRKKSPSMPSKLIPDRRQSSLNGFVQHSDLKSSKTSALKQPHNFVTLSSQQGPSSRSQTEQKKLTLQQTQPNRNTRQSKKSAAADDLRNDDPSPPPQLSVEASGLVQEQTSSDDRPKATTIARRTSSLSAKTRPRREKGKAPSKRSQKKLSDDEYYGQSDTDPQSDVVERDHPQATAQSAWAIASKSGQTGRFTEDEQQALFAWRNSFCIDHHLSHPEFNDIMTASMRKGKEKWPLNSMTKTEFMRQYYDQLPSRNRRAMLRFRERHFQNVEVSPWTADDDNELRDLVRQIGTKWVEIAQLMGRTQDFVSQRWRHKLNYGHETHGGEWTTEELTLLEEEVEVAAAARGTTPDDESLQIPWNVISLKIGNGRSAQQCSNRWRVSTTRRINGKFVKIPLSDRIPGSATQKPRKPSKVARRLAGDTKQKKRAKKPKLADDRPMKTPEKQYKSQERIVDSSDNDEADDESEKTAHSEIGRSESEIESRNGDTDVSSASEADDSSTQAKGSEIAQDTNHQMDSERPPTSSRSEPSLNSQSGRATSQGSSSHNPIKTSSAKTPVNRLTLSQLHNGTQANSSIKRSTGRSIKSRVPDSVLPERPSPELSIRRRPLSSPLDMQTIGRGGSDQDSTSEGDESEKLRSDSPRNPHSFVSARATEQDSEMQSTTGSSASKSTSNSSSASQSESATDGHRGATNGRASSSTTSEDESDSSSEKPEPEPQSSFWQSVNSIARKVVPGLSQSQSRSSSGKETQKKTKSLADLLSTSSRTAGGNDESETDEE